MYATTHNGVFHADDVFASAVIRLVKPDLAILRTRDPQRIADAEIAFDVGEGKYDHHQRGGNGQRLNGIPFASFGLIWRDFGAAAVQWVLVDLGSVPPEDIAAEVDRMLVQQVDAADNGVSLHSGEPTFEGVRGVSISGAISWFNPIGDDGFMDVAFWDAVEVADAILRRAIIHAAAAVEGRAYIDYILRRDGDYGYVALDRFIPDWQVPLIPTKASYVVYPSAGSWRVQGIPVAYGRPEVRRPLPETWAALSGTELQAASGVADATFCHKGRFIAGASSKDGAISLALAALGEK